MNLNNVFIVKSICIIVFTVFCHQILAEETSPYVKFMRDLCFERDDYFSYDKLREELKNQGKSSWVPHFGDVLFSFTFAEFAENSENNYNYIDLPFPLLWKFLDRKKEIVIHNFGASKMWSHLDRPKGEEESTLFSKLLTQSIEQNRIVTGVINAGDKENHGSICYLKIILIEIITDRITKDSGLWSKEWPERIIREFIRRGQCHAEKPEEWLLKRAYQKAIKEICTSNLWNSTKRNELWQELKLSEKEGEQNIWESDEFKAWLMNNKNTYIMESQSPFRPRSKKTKRNTMPAVSSDCFQNRRNCQRGIGHCQAAVFDWREFAYSFNRSGRPVRA